MKYNKTTLLLLDFFLIFSVCLSFLLWYWWLRPYNPLEIMEPLEVLNENKTVISGQELHYRVVFKKNTDKKATISRRMVDGVVYNFPQIFPQNPTGQHDTSTFIEIPRAIPEGTYILESTACYQMNPIREVCVTYSTEEFKVIK